MPANGEEEASVVVRIPADVKAFLDAKRVGDESYGSVLRRLLKIPPREAKAVSD